jgi:hypothetical protein
MVNEAIMSSSACTMISDNTQIGTLEAELTVTLEERVDAAIIQLCPDRDRCLGSELWPSR